MLFVFAKADELSQWRFIHPAEAAIRRIFREEAVGGQLPR